ncbi:MAG: nucleotide-binding protein [Thermoanaerobaculia bacterium]
MKVFIGSSKESTELMDWVALSLEELGLDPVKWTHPGLFPPGEQAFLRLIDITASVSAAIFIFAEDDKAWYRGDAVGIPRDNILIEYGLFTGKFGSQRAIVCVSGKPKTASDLLGLTHIDLTKKERAKTEIKEWVKALKPMLATQEKPNAELAAAHGFLKQEYESLRRLLDESMAATHYIYSQHNPELPRVRILEQNYLISINERGDCHCHERRKQVADSIYGMELFTVFGDPPVEDFQRIQFLATIERRELVVLPAYNKPSEKRFLAFFLPFLPEKEEHTLSFSWRWPGMWDRLLRGVPDVWEVKVPFRWSVDHLTITFHLHESLPRIKMSNIGQGGGSSVALNPPSGSPGYMEYQWVIQNVRAGANPLLRLQPVLDVV